MATTETSPSSSTPPSQQPDYEKAILLIDEAHSEDPNKTTQDGIEVPYELHYAQRCTYWLQKRAPDASMPLKIAVRAQHFRRWEIPRSSYPMTKPGYFSWRTFLKSRQASLTSTLCATCSLPPQECDQIAAWIRKDELFSKSPDAKYKEGTQILEDVACLVFLEDQFEGFEKELKDEEKMVGILRKTWGKMSEEGRGLALGMGLSGKSLELVGKALNG